MPVGDVEYRIGPECRPASIAALATRQQGVVSKTQLHQLGLTERKIKGAIDAQRLIPLHRGVYAVGHAALGFKGRVMAAVLAGGEGAAASHRTAAALWAMAPQPRTVEVSVPRSRRWDNGTLQVHRPRLLAEDVVLLGAIPVTSVARTLVDLAAATREHELRRLLHEAERQRLVDRADVLALMRNRPPYRGVAVLRKVLATNSAPGGSELERRFLELIARAGFPAPRRNSVVEIRRERFEVDTWWPAAKLVVELDGFADHGLLDNFEKDRRRDELFKAEGIDVIRVTWRRVTREPDDLVRSLRQLLGDVRAE